VEVVPDEADRDAIAKTVGVADVLRLDACFDLTRHGREGLRVLGRVSATVNQSCVVTLEPVQNEIDEAVDLVFHPQARLADSAGEGPLSIDAGEPEALNDGVVDLGMIAVEFLILGIDPYPRKPGAVFEAPATKDAAAHPFAALAALQQGKNGKNR
jgi:hypothetical protein